MTEVISTMRSRESTSRFCGTKYRLGRGVWTLSAFRFESGTLVHGCMHLFLPAECTQGCYTAETDPDRDLTISFRSKTVSDLFKIYLGGAHLRQLTR